MAESDPAIEFVHPKPNEKLSDYPIYIETAVHNFRLLPPVQYWSGYVAPEDVATGHIHYTLDDAPIYATSETQLVLGKNDGIHLPVGKHVLKAELVHSNHRGLTAPVAAQVTFFCERGPEKGPKVSISPAAKKELLQIQQQLLQVQQQIGQIQNGASTENTSSKSTKIESVDRPSVKAPPAADEPGPDTN